MMRRLPSSFGPVRWRSIGGRGVTVLVLGVLLVCVGCARRVELPAEADRSSRSWLALVDAADYGDAWHASASIFRAAVTIDNWEERAQSVRGPLGSLQRRIRRDVLSKTNPMSSPRGEYLMITFDSAFENNASMVETVTMFQESDGSWRVAGYFVK